jgi:hypothetical protein
MSLFESYSPRARRTIFLAHLQAHKEGAREITPEHILYALLKEDSELFAILIPEYPNPANELEGSLVVEGRSQPIGKNNKGKLPLSPRSKEIVWVAAKEQERLRHKSVGTQHLLLALLASPRERSSWFHRHEQRDDSMAKQILVKYGLSAASVEARIKEGIVTPLTWVLDDSIIKLNAQLTAIAELLISKGLFERSDLVAMLDQNEGPITPQTFLVPLIDALYSKGSLTAAEKQVVLSVGLPQSSGEQDTARTSGPIAEGGSSTKLSRESS